MEAYTDNLRKFLDQIRSISLWNRIFNWRSITGQLYTVMADLQRLSLGFDSYREKCLKSDSLLAAQNERLIVLERDRSELSQHLKHANEDLIKYRDELISLKKDDQFRRTEHSNAMATLTRLQRDLLDDRKKESDEKARMEHDRLIRMKETWLNHQDNVRSAIKTICSKHAIEYVEKVPFKGDPDNTLKICDEYVVFDAKSPAGDDLTNFPSYIKDQAEKAKKYCREEGARNEIFLVVPTNTLTRIKQFVFNLADYKVYVVSLDTLEPVILSLQKLEEYEFVDQLSPEERENICRVLGKFAHLTKRRIQIDTFFIKQFMELAYRSESDLPADILGKVIEFEKAEKLNPPTERRSKRINIKELDEDAVKLRNETHTKGIAPIEGFLSSELDKMPLYRGEFE
ncbi:MAG: hypothetical protein JNK79_17880 [Chitinophagaceae bacterium]|nr:hypothetical protein [Chitinophagaceae bacterium]